METFSLENHMAMLLALVAIAAVLALSVVALVLRYGYRLKVAWRNGSIDIDPPDKLLPK